MRRCIYFIGLMALSIAMAGPTKAAIVGPALVSVNVASYGVTRSSIVEGEMSATTSFSGDNYYVESGQEVVFLSPEEAKVTIDTRITKTDYVVYTLGQGNVSEFAYEALIDSILECTWSLDYSGVGNPDLFAGANVNISVVNPDNVDIANEQLPLPYPPNYSWDSAVYPGDATYSLIAGKSYIITVENMSSNGTVSAFDDIFTGWIQFDFNGATVPIPGAVWLLGSGFIGIVGIRRKLKN